jgi:hypothetical protein
MYLVEILKLKDEGWFSSSECSEANLHSMLKVCESQQIGQMGLQATQAMHTIRDELARRASDLAAQSEERRHRESTALSRAELAASHYANRLSLWAIGISLLALLGSGLSILWQWRDRSPSMSASQVRQPATAQSNTGSLVSFPSTNGQSTNKVVPP